MEAYNLKTVISTRNRQNKARKVFDKDTSSFLYEKIREQRAIEAKQKAVDNRKKLEAYISQLRAEYAENTEFLAFLENNVISKWIVYNYTRSANLAHFDVERALENYNSK